MQSLKHFKNSFLKQNKLYIFLLLSLLSNANSSYLETADKNETEIPKEPISFDSKEGDLDNIIKIVGYTINVTYVIFLLLSLYLICKIKTVFKQNASYSQHVYKFIYLTNNGYIVISVAAEIYFSDDKYNHFFINILAIGGFVFLIGTIWCICQSKKTSCANLCDDYCPGKFLKELFVLPCKYVWTIISLTNDCCSCDNIPPKNGTEACLFPTFNYICMLIKYLGMIIATIVYYLFFLIILVVVFIVMIILGIIGLFYLCCEKRAKTEQNEENNTNNENNTGNEAPYQQMPDNNANQIESKTDYDQMNQENENIDNNQYNAIKVEDNNLPNQNQFENQVPSSVEQPNDN